MKTILQSLFIGTIILVFISCGSNSEKNNALADKKTALEKLKTQQNTLTNQIKNLETEIAKLDTSSSNSVAKLVGLSAVTSQYFAHYIDLQGSVTSDNISYVSPRMGPGQVRAIYIKKGDMVRQGQLLIKLDDAVIKQSVIAAQKSLETLKVQLSFAKDLYQRQNNLWKEGIGTEVQLISAKNNVQSLERQLSASEEQIKVAEEQLKGSNVIADVAGVVDELNVRIGEIFAGIAGVSPQIKIVNTAAMKVITEIPENYSSKIKQGSKVIINLPDINKNFNSTVATASRTINANNRSFEVEVKIPYDVNIRPNQLAQIKFLDYEAANALAININTVQTDEKGKYVYIAEPNGNKLIARKKMIVVGEVNGQLIEVKSGINAGDQLVTEGYQNIYEGQLLTVLVK